MYRQLPMIQPSTYVHRNAQGSHYTASLPRADHNSVGSCTVPNVIDMDATLSIPMAMVANSLNLTKDGGPRDIDHLPQALSFHRGQFRGSGNELPGEKGTPTILKYDFRSKTFTHSATLAYIEGKFPGGAKMRYPSIVGQWSIDLTKLRPEALDRISRHNGGELVLGPEDWVSSSLLSLLP
jgi:hypothetical protein